MYNSGKPNHVGEDKFFIYGINGQYQCVSVHSDIQLLQSEAHISSYKTMVLAFSASTNIRVFVVIMLQPRAFLCSSYAFTVSVWVIPWDSGLLPQSKHINIRLAGGSNLPLVVLFRFFLSFIVLSHYLTGQKSNPNIAAQS